MSIVSAMSCRCRSMRIMSMIIVSASTSADLMELDPIVGIFFFAVESDIRQIVPDREDRSTHDVREEDLIEHKEYPEWYDRILMSDHPTIEDRLLHSLSIEQRVPHPDEYRPRMEYICLIDHIDHRSEHRDREVYHSDKIQNRIERRMCGLSDDKSSVHRKENCEDIDEIYSYTHDEYCESKRKESTSRT